MKEMTFKAGDLVWHPEAGFVKLRENIDGLGRTNPAYPLRTESIRFRVDGRVWESHKHRSLLTVEEAELLGFERPKRKAFGFIEHHTFSGRLTPRYFLSQSERDDEIRRYDSDGTKEVVHTFEFEV